MRVSAMRSFAVAVLFGLAGGACIAQTIPLQFPADLTHPADLAHSSPGQQASCGTFYNGAPQCSPTNSFAGQGSCDSNAPFCAGGNPGQTGPSSKECQSTPDSAINWGFWSPYWGLTGIGNDPHLDMAGLVGGGFVDGAGNANCDLPGFPACKEPHLSNDDLCHDHRDRDINVVVLPATSWNRTRYDPRWSLRDNLNGWNVGPPMGAINTELEWRYFLPTVGSSAFDRGPANDGDVGLRPTQFPGACGVWSNSGDCTFNLGVPHGGDDILVRGRVVLDCGHINTTGATELHPFTGMVWLHPLTNDTNFTNGPDPNAADGVVWLRLMSHEGNPVQNFTPANTTQLPFSALGSGGAVTGRFHIPGYPSPTGETLYIGPVRSDWVLDPNHGVTAAPVGGCACRKFPDPLPSDWTCNLPSGGWRNSSGQPATVSDMNYHQATDIFDISAVDDSAINPGFVKVTASFKGLPHGETDTSTDLPFVVGAHMEVCYPVCDANGCQKNRCPGMCKNAASCVGGYTTNFDVDGSIVVPLAVTYNMDVTVGVGNEMPGVTLAGHGVGNLDVWNGANPSYPPNPDSYRVELFGLQPYFRSQPPGGVLCSGPIGGSWADGTQVIYGLDCNSYQRTWRYNALTGQISIARTTPKDQPNSTAKCLDTQGQGTTRGTYIVLSSCDPSSSTQKWVIDQGNSVITGGPLNGEGLINSIWNPGSGLCLAESTASSFLYLENCSSVIADANRSWVVYVQ